MQDQQNHLVKMSVTTNKNKSKPFSSTTVVITFSSSAFGVQEHRLYQQRLLVQSLLSQLPIWNSLASREINCSIVFPLKISTSF